MTQTSNSIDSVKRLEDILAISEVVYSYAHFIDRGHAEQLAELFVPDARFRARVKGADNANGDLMDISGRQAIQLNAEQTFKRITTLPNIGQVNIITQPLITVDGDEATACAYSTIVRGSAAGREISIYGRYHDKLVRCGDGRWRFKDRVLEIESSKT